MQKYSKYPSAHVQKYSKSLLDTSVLQLTLMSSIKTFDSPMKFVFFELLYELQFFFIEFLGNPRRLGTFV